MMREGLSDYVVNGKYGPTFDFERLTKLSDTDFLRVYNEEMAIFVENHGENPHCNRCSGEIETPTELVRYFGESLHFNCFRDVYSKERKGLEEESWKKYFDRVLWVKSLE